MAPTQLSTVEQRVARAAEAALEDKGYVNAIDVLLGLGWLPHARVDAWWQGRLPYLEAACETNLKKVATAMDSFRAWAEERGLDPREASYRARTTDRRPLRFSTSGDAAVERGYRTHWMSPDVSERARARLVRRAGRLPDLVVILPLKDWTCQRCEGTGDLLIMEGPGAMCLGCADLDHLVFLPSGNAALTRRARKNSTLSAVVVRFSRSRTRYERQGVLVEEHALERAEAQCLADEEVRSRRRQRDHSRRAVEDEQLQARIAEEIIRLFPGCPQERAVAIARHAASRGTGRVGRTAAARDLDPLVIELAVAASVRHRETRYDELLMAGMERVEARAQVQADVATILDGWRRPPREC